MLMSTTMYIVTIYITDDEEEDEEEGQYGLPPKRNFIYLGWSVIVAGYAYLTVCLSLYSMRHRDWI